MKPKYDVTDHPARILIVDDEQHNRQLLEVMLGPGYELRSAASGEEALAMMAEQLPDLVLLDIMMPGMDGYEVVGQIKGGAATSNIPVIMVTALDDRESRMLGLSAGAEDFLSKPIDRTELCVRVRNLLRLKAYADYHDHYSHILEGEVGSRTAELVERTRSLERQADVLGEQAALLDLAQDAIVVRDMDGRIVFWSRGAEAMYGWSGHDAVGQMMDEILKADYPEPAADPRTTLLRHSRWEGEVTHRALDGSSLIVASRWALQRDAVGAPVRVLTIHNDITARKRADAELALLTKRLSLATDVARIGVWEWDLSTDTLTWDTTMFDIYGIRATAAMPYARWTAGVHAEDLAALEASLQKVIADKGEGEAEFRIIHEDGAVRNISSCERAVIDDGGKVTRLIGVNMDITERKEAEAALERHRSDQIRFKDEFLSHVSHELRSPLTAVKQFTTILLGGLAGELNKEQREYQQIVLKNIRQLQSMIDDLLEVTRLEAGKLTIEPESISVLDAVTDTINTLQVTARAKGVTLSCDLPADLPAAYADQIRLQQILIILIENAIKFTADGGAIIIHAGPAPDASGFLLIEVSDTGCGISPDISERVFERLFQVTGQTEASRKGLGLGLYICKELVIRHGGRIWVERRPQKGSTFSFTLPVSSVKTVIAPLFKNDTWPADSVGLVVVAATMAGEWPSRASREEWSHHVRNVVQSCLLPDLDVLLPTPQSDGAERFFVACFTDEKGVSSLANRLRKQFERVYRLKHPGLTLSVSHRMLPPLAVEAGASVEQAVSHLSTHLEQSIDWQPSRRLSTNE